MMVYDALQILITYIYVILSWRLYNIANKFCGKTEKLADPFWYIIQRLEDWAPAKMYISNLNIGYRVTAAKKVIIL